VLSLSLMFPENGLFGSVFWPVQGIKIDYGYLCPAVVEGGLIGENTMFQTTAGFDELILEEI
jgi:hypothetical protein